MDKKEILSVVKNNVKDFDDIIKDNPFQLRGMFNSELLLICSLIKDSWVTNIIESGRARGHSTKTLCDFFSDEKYKIKSIDFDKDSEDVRYSERKLKKYKNIELLYGDSNDIIPKLITENSVVVIDWPKWQDALLLAIKLLKNKKIKMIMIHDLHKTSFERNIFDILFNNVFCSDDLDFVEKFSNLDDDCWSILKGHWEQPYIRNWKKNYSYASTISIIFNKKDTLKKPEIDNYLEFHKRSTNISLWMYLTNTLWSWNYIIQLLKKVKKIFK